MNDKARKWLLIAIKLILFLIIVALTIIITESYHGNAEITVQTDKHFVIVTGDTPLGGVSLVRQKVIDKGMTLPEQDDIELLANVMFYENWSTDKDHLAAYYTGAVVLNRVKHKWFPDTIRGVLYQRGQYATTHKFFTKEIPDECYELAKKLLREGAPEMPENVIYQSTHKNFGSGVWKCINGEYFNYE